MFKQILIVDDNPSDLLIASAVLESSQRIIFTAKSGFDGIDKLSDETIDLFIVDLQMPQMAGVDLIRRIRKIERYRTTPILVMSGRGQTRDVSGAIQAGASDYIVKPVEDVVLEEKVARLLGVKTDSWEQYQVKGVVTDSSGRFVKPFEILSMNEIGLTVETAEPRVEGEIVEIMARIFDDRDLGPQQIRIDKITANQGVYLIAASFLATTDVFRKEIRLLCRELWRAKDRSKQGKEPA